MSSLDVSINEADVIKLVLEFLEKRHLHISQLSLERESGVINGRYSDDALFLRQLILDGQWDTAIDFVQPLKVSSAFNFAKVQYLIYKHKYYELLCIKLDPLCEENSDFTVDQVVECLKLIEPVAPTSKEYNRLCALLTLSNLRDDAEFRYWNPSSARVQCFQAIYPLVFSFLPAPGESDNSTNAAQDDRLLQLVVKGLLYECAVDYCQKKVLSKDMEKQTISLGALLQTSHPLGDVDASLLAWLLSVPRQAFSHPFEAKSLELNITRLKRPLLEACWSQEILASPIVPQKFPHSAVPHALHRSGVAMSRSMVPNYEGLCHGLEVQASLSSRTGRTKSLRPALSQSMIAGFQISSRGSDEMQRSTLDVMLDKGSESVALTLQDSDFESKPAVKAGFDQLCSPIDEEEEELEAADKSRRNSIFGSSKSLIKDYSGDRFPHSLRKPRNFRKDANQGHGASVMTMSCMMPGNYEKPSESPLSAAASSPAISSSRSFPKKIASCNDSTRSDRLGGQVTGNVRFVAVTRLEDQQAIRCAAFHPSGRLYAVGTNSRQLHICLYPALKNLKSDHVTKAPEIVLTRPKQHRGSVYCTSFNPTGELLATGSNDKTIRLTGFNAESLKTGVEHELNIHNGTVRDVVFMEDRSNRTSLLLSGGAGSCNVCITDCTTGMLVRSLPGHSAPILALNTWSGCMFISCSMDRTIRFWDLRCANAVNVLSASSRLFASPVTSVCVDPSGRLLVSGHEDASVMLYDIQGSKLVQLYKPHVDEVRTVRFSPGTYYLLSGSYDRRVIITDMRGDLMAPLKYLPVVEHDDKIIQCRWHPQDFTFLSTSADRSAVLWALPPLTNS